MSFDEAFASAKPRKSRLEREKEQEAMAEQAKKEEQTSQGMALKDSSNQNRDNE